MAWTTNGVAAKAESNSHNNNNNNVNKEEDEKLSSPTTPHIRHSPLAAASHSRRRAAQSRPEISLPLLQTDDTDKASTTTTTTPKLHYPHPNPYQGCQEIFVGAGWGGVYSFYRRVMDGVARNQSASQYCLMEQSSRIGGRTYSVPVSHRHTNGTDFVVDVGAYRFTPDMQLMGDLMMHHLQLPTVCYDPTCPPPDHSEFPEQSYWNYTAPFRRMVDPTTGLPTGFDTALQHMVQACQDHGARVFLQTKLVQLHIPQMKKPDDHPNVEDDDDDKDRFQIVFENTATGVRSPVIYHPSSRTHHNTPNATSVNATKTPTDSRLEDRPTTVKVLVLNLPRHHLLQVEGLREALEPPVVQTLECMVWDTPVDLFGQQAVQRLQDQQQYRTTFGKAYLYYDQAWWHTLLNKTHGTWPPSSVPDKQYGMNETSISTTTTNASTSTTTTVPDGTFDEALGSPPVETPQGVLLKVRWHDGPVQCQTTTIAHPKDNVQEEEGEYEVSDITGDDSSSWTTAADSSLTTTTTTRTCRGFLEVYYSVSNETFYSSLPAATDLQDETSLPQLEDPLGMVWVQDSPHARVELGLVHAALMESLAPLWNATSELQQARSLVEPPTGMVVGIWQRPNPRYDQHPLGVGWTDPTKVLYEPSMSGPPDQACGGVAGLTEETYRHTVLQPFHVQPLSAVMEPDDDDSTTTTNRRRRNLMTMTKTNTQVSETPRIFVVNNDFVCTNVRHSMGDWAEESLMQAERAMYLLGTPKPAWLKSADYYQRHVVHPAQFLTRKTPVPGMTIASVAALGSIVALSLGLFVYEVWRRRPGNNKKYSRAAAQDADQLLHWNADAIPEEQQQEKTEKEQEAKSQKIKPQGRSIVSFFGDVDGMDLTRDDSSSKKSRNNLLVEGGAEPEKGDTAEEEEEDGEGPSEEELDAVRKDALNLWRWQNLAIPVSYWVGGTSAGMFRTFLNVYPLDIGANEAQQTTCATLAALPAAFKILYGFTSDTNPIMGYRRKPYLFLGWFLASMTMLSLLATSDLTLVRERRVVTDEADGGLGEGELMEGQEHEQDMRDIVIVPDNAPSLLQLSTCFFLFGFGMWFANAMTDALVAEKAKYEPEAVRGTLQSTCYLMRFFGLMVSAPISTFLYSRVGPQIIVQCLVWVPCLVLPLLYILAEPRVTVKPVKEQCDEIWRTVCSRSVWEPMAFMYLFNLLQMSNAAWRQFLVTVLHFTPANLNTLLVVSYVLVYLGTMLYKYCLLHTSWRLIYQGCLVLNLILSSMQLLLIRGHTFGISPFLFALGDDAFAEFLNGIQFLPAVIMMVSLCPTGSEGTREDLLISCDLWLPC